MTQGVVYLLHFDRPYKHAEHYLGYTDDLPKRLDRHWAGAGAKLLAVLRAAGIGWHCVRTWANVDRKFERTLKKRKNARRLCPVCSPQLHTWPLRAIDDAAA